MNDDLEEFFVELSAARTSGRDKLDKYRDFREVFLGTDAGKRVLYDILALGEIFRSTLRGGNPYLLMAQEGRRYIATEILRTVREEPKPNPARQQPKEP